MSDSATIFNRQLNIDECASSIYRNSYYGEKAHSGPFSDPELLILASLAESQKHGYAIMTDVLTFADVELGPGTLYSAITRLVEMGWIEPCQPSGRQRPYKLTPAGGRHLQTQLAKMRHLAEIGLKRLRVYMTGRVQAARILLRAYPASLAG